MTKDLYTENYKTLMKEIKNDTNRWRDMPCSWKNMSLIGRIDILKMGLLPKAIYRFKEITLEFLVLMNIPWLYNILTLRKAGCSIHMRVCSIAQSFSSCCDSMDCALPGFSVHIIFQARILEWVFISSSRGFSQSRDLTRISCVFCIADRFFISEPLEKPKEFTGLDYFCNS